MMTAPALDSFPPSLRRLITVCSPRGGEPDIPGESPRLSFRSAGRGIRDTPGVGGGAPMSARPRGTLCSAAPPYSRHRDRPSSAAPRPPGMGAAPPGTRTFPPGAGASPPGTRTAPRARRPPLWARGPPLQCRDRPSGHPDRPPRLEDRPQPRGPALQPAHWPR